MHVPPEALAGAARALREVLSVRYPDHVWTVEPPPPPEPERTADNAPQRKPKETT